LFTDIPTEAFRLELRLETFVASALSWCPLWFEGFHHEEREKMQDKRQKAENSKYQIANNKGPATSHQHPAAGDFSAPLRSGRNDRALRPTQISGNRCNQWLK